MALGSERTPNPVTNTVTGFSESDLFSATEPMIGYVILRMSCSVKFDNNRMYVKGEQGV